MGDALLIQQMSSSGDSQILPTFYKYIYSNSATIQTIDLSHHEGWQYILSVGIYTLGATGTVYGYIEFTPSDTSIQNPLYQSSVNYVTEVNQKHKIFAYTSGSLYYVTKTSTDALGHYLSWVLTVGS